MAEATLTDRLVPATCAGCGKSLNPGEAGSVAPCASCLMLSVWSAAYHRWMPLLPPRYSREECWKLLCGQSLDGDRARLGEGLLRLIPCSRGMARSAASSGDQAGDILEPLADLLPSNFPARALTAPAKGSSGSGMKDLDLGAASALAAGGDLVDPILTGKPDHPEQVCYTPIWQFTYAVDYKERAACVDAVSGRPMGPAQAPDRSRPVIGAIGAGGAAYIAAILLSGQFLPVMVSAPVSGLLAWGISLLVFGRLLRKARNR